MNVRSWLRRMPQPTRVRLDKKKLVHIGEGKTKWRDVVDAIAIEQPHIVEALDADGVVLRSTELTDGEQTKEDKKDDDDDGEKLPPEFAVLRAFGKLLLEAYVKGAEQHAHAYELSFAENTKLVGVLSQRLVGLEHALQKTHEQRMAEIAKYADDPEGLDALLSGPMAPMLMSFAEKLLSSGKHDKPNGKAKTA